MQLKLLADVYIIKPGSSMMETWGQLSHHALQLQDHAASRY